MTLYMKLILIGQQTGSQQVTVAVVWPLTFRFIGEESVAAGERLELTDSPTWIIDPIDGTVNFVHRWQAPPTLWCHRLESQTSWKKNLPVLWWCLSRFSLIDSFIQLLVNTSCWSFTIKVSVSQCSKDIWLEGFYFESNAGSVEHIIYLYHQDPSVGICIIYIKLCHLYTLSFSSM